MLFPAEVKHQHKMSYCGIHRNRLIYCMNGLARSCWCNVEGSGKAPEMLKLQQMNQTDEDGLGRVIGGGIPGKKAKVKSVSWVKGYKDQTCWNRSALLFHGYKSHFEQSTPGRENAIANMKVGWSEGLLPLKRRGKKLYSGTLGISGVWVETKLSHFLAQDLDKLFNSLLWSEVSKMKLPRNAEKIKWENDYKSNYYKVNNITNDLNSLFFFDASWWITS